MNKHRLAALAIIVIMAIAATMAVGCASDGGDGNGDGGASILARAPDMDKGAELYAASCALCHGERGIGTQAGPPLVHIIYEPGHHPDASFRNAVKNGVAAHHWSFGNMPPRPELSGGDIDDVIAYVRALQREAGIE